MISCYEAKKDIDEFTLGISDTKKLFHMKNCNFSSPLCFKKNKETIEKDANLSRTIWFSCFLPPQIAR